MKRMRQVVWWWVGWLLLFPTRDAVAASDPAAGRSGPAVVFEALSAAIRDHYPMLEMTALSGGHWAADYRARIAVAPDDQAAFEIMDELVCELNDYHTRLIWPGKPRLTSPPVRVEPVLTAAQLGADYGIWGQVRPPRDLPPLEQVALAVVAAAPGVGLQAGDEIRSVDGVPVLSALRQAWRHAVGSSTGSKLAEAAWRMLAGEKGSELRLQVDRQQAGGGIETRAVVLRRTGALAEELIARGEAEGVPLIRITRWENRAGQPLVARFDQLLEAVRGAPGLVIDLRGNGGGSDQLASQVVGRFIDQPVISSISFHRQVPTLKFERTVEWTPPRGPWRYGGRVAVLTDEGCKSAGEHFVSGMIEAGALVCGTPTSGACGWIRTVDLPGGARLNVSRTFPLHTGGIPSPQLGMAPHRWAPRRLADLRAGRDTALQAALAWIKSDEKLPPRLQPMAPLSGPRAVSP